MNTLRIRNMFLLVTALAVMFLLACGSSEITEEAVIQSNQLVQQGIDYNKEHGFTIIEEESYSPLGEYTWIYVKNTLPESDYSGDPEIAIDYFTKAIKLNNKNNEAYFQRGITYERAYPDGLEQYDKAIDDYTKVIELKPDDDKAYIRRGMVYPLALDQIDKALKDLDKALELNPYNEMTLDLKKFLLWIEENKTISK